MIKLIQIILFLSMSIFSNTMIAKTSAVIFDCDGVLVDTEYLKYQAWKQALSKNSVTFTLEEYMPLIGGSSKKIMAEIKKQKNLQLDEAQLISHKNKIYTQLQKNGVTLLPDAILFLKTLITNKNQYGIKIGLASSASKQEIIENLRQINVNLNDFDAIVSGRDDLKHIHDPEGTNKPKPYIYTLIAHRLGVQPIECLVFEDSNAGVVAAADAGMMVIAVPNLFTKNHDFTKARLITTFKQVNSDILFNI